MIDLQSRRGRLLAGGLAAAALLTAYSFWSDGGDAADEAADLVAKPVAARSSAAASTGAAGARLQLPDRRKSLLASALDLFAGHSWYVPPPPPPRTAPVEVKPTAPPLPYGFFGSYTKTGDAAVYYLVRGDRIFDVRVGDVVEGTYHVDGDENGQLRFTYLPLNTPQTLAIGNSQ
jgi:hypothetical protein